MRLALLSGDEPEQRAGTVPAPPATARLPVRGASAPLTDEHVYGKWLRKLGYTGEGVREIWFSAEILWATDLSE